MYVQIFQLPIGNCGRIPKYLFRGEFKKILKDFRTNLRFAIIGQALWKNRKWRRWYLEHKLPYPIYLYPDPARTNRAIGAISVARVKATAAKPFLEVYHDDGFAVILNGKVVRSCWGPSSMRKDIVYLPMKKGQKGVLKIYWFDYCCTGGLAVIPHGLRESQMIDGILGLTGLAMVILGISHTH